MSKKFTNLNLCPSSVKINPTIQFFTSKAYEKSYIFAWIIYWQIYLAENLDTIIYKKFIFKSISYLIISEGCIDFFCLSYRHVNDWRIKYEGFEMRFHIPLCFSLEQLPCSYFMII